MDLKTIFLVAFLVFAAQAKAVEDETQEDANAVSSDEKDFEDSPAEIDENDSEDENQEDEASPIESNDEQNDPKGKLKLNFFFDNYECLYPTQLHYFITYFISCLLE